MYELVSSLDLMEAVCFGGRDVIADLQVAANQKPVTALQDDIMCKTENSFCLVESLSSL